MARLSLSTRILIGLALGAAAGIGAQVFDVAWLSATLLAIEPLGTAFVRLISMVVVPLVVGSLFVGTASLGDLRKLGRLGGKTLALFGATTGLAAAAGLGLGLVFRPGDGMDSSVQAALTREVAERAAQSAEVATELPSLVDQLVGMIPRNPVQAAAETDLLPLIVATLLFGAAAGGVSTASRTALLGFFQGVNDLSMVVVGWIMNLAPYAVFALIAASVARFGVDLLQSLVFYSLLMIAGLVAHAVLVLGGTLRLLARIPFGRFLRESSDALLLAFSTSSSNATLPVSIEVAEDRFGVSPGVASFVLPLGATLNMNGGALYKALTAVFVAQVYGVALGPGHAVVIVVTASLAAVAGVGVPGSSLVTTLIVLNAIGLGPQAAAGIALVVGVDRILDMVRTTVNVAGDLACTAVIARSEGEPLERLLRTGP